MAVLGILRVLMTAENEKFVKDMKTSQKTVTDFKNEIPGLSKVLNLVTNPAVLAGAAIAGIGKFAKDSIDATMKWGLTVDDTARSLSTTTEEASKLLIMTDDLRVDMGVLKTAFRMALNDGIVPSIDGLIALSGEYIKITDPAQRAQFATEKFGKAGLEMMKILEQGPDKLRDMANAVDKDARVMSAQGVQAAKDYWAQLDNIEDSAEQTKIMLGTELLPEVIKVANAMNEGIGVMMTDYRARDKYNKLVSYGAITQDEYNQAIRSGQNEQEMMQGGMTKTGKAILLTAEAEELADEKLKAYSDSTMDARDRIALLTGAFGKLSKSEEEVTAETARVKLEQEELKLALSELNDFMSTELTAAAVDYREKQRDLNQEAKTLQEEIGKLEKLRWLSDEQREQLIENKAKLNEIQEQIKANAAEHESATKRIMFDLLSQRAAMDGLTSGELELLGEIAKKWGLVDQATVDATKAADQALVDFANGQGMTETISQLDTALYLADGWSKKLYDINGKMFTVDVLTNYHYTGSPPSTGGGGGGGSTTPTTPYQSGRPVERGGGQSGLHEVVPAGYPNDSAVYRASSGEQVDITPAGEKNTAGIRIGSVIMQITNPVANGDQLYREFKRRLTEDLRTERLRA